MKTIGTKASQELIIVSIYNALILPLFLTVWMISLEYDTDNGFHISFYVAVLLALFMILNYILTLTKPKILIQADLNSIQICKRFKQKVIIPLDQIIEIIPQEVRFHKTYYKFGKITLRTQNKQYVIDNVNDCINVAIELTILVEEYPDKTSK